MYGYFFFSFVNDYVMCIVGLLVGMGVFGYIFVFVFID